MISRPYRSSHDDTKITTKEQFLCESAIIDAETGMMYSNSVRGQRIEASVMKGGFDLPVNTPRYGLPLLSGVCERG
jgi:hypothetical protein